MFNVINVTYVGNIEYDVRLYTNVKGQTEFKTTVLRCPSQDCGEMPFPLEAIYPLGIVAAALAAGGLALDYTNRYFNHGKVESMTRHTLKG